jgi:molecular chaperone DnaJ
LIGLAEKRDYYDVLGVQKGASKEEIKDAYKHMAKQFHPDVSSDPKAKEKFQEVLEAYSVLSDEQKRSNYDQFGHAAEQFQGYQGQGFGQGMDFDFSDLFSGMGGFEDLFREFGFAGAGERPGRRKSRHGGNLRVDLNISFEEAAFGVKKEIELERLEKCDECNGKGSKSDGETTCPTCGGHGVIERMQRTPFGIFSTRTTCPKCQGYGKIIKNPCPKCNGKGIIRKKKKIEVNIPAGVNTGNHLRLQGMGDAGELDGQAGDLFVVLFVEKHKFFKRDGPDVFAEIPISFAEAALGTEVDAPTLKGEVKLKIPAGTQSGTIFRLKGKGIKDLDSGKQGAEFIKILIETPQNLSKEQKKLFEELKKMNGIKEKRHGLFGRF